MAGALVGGAFLSGFINVVFDRLLSLEAVNFIRGKKLDKELLERLETALTTAEALLTDAEHKQFLNPSVKKWLDRLKDAVYDADDLLDHVLTEAATQKKKGDDFLPGLLNPEETEMVTEIEKIVRKIEDLVKRKDDLELKRIPKENLSWRTPSTSLVGGEMDICGRENDQDALIKLLSDDNTEGKVSVIPIVGMGGVGKTTLARWLYNNEGLMKEFDLKVWVCVSEPFDIVEITKTMIEAVTAGPCERKDLNLLQLNLKDNLTGKKFFIVLDDVWNEDEDVWNSLAKPFQYGHRGSKIIVTTRSKEVASIFLHDPHFLNELSDEHCWSIFAKNACFSESNGNVTLEEIGREIVKKCKGLPLAAQTLGRLVRAEHDVQKWNDILTSEIWEFPKEKSKIIPALLISYYHLSPQSKRCFIYCSLFPKDHRFDKDKLTLLWMAEDLLERPNKGKTLEEVGSMCFDDLASRLFFKQISGDDKSSFVMHDLIHDLATFLAGEFYFRSQKCGKVADEMSMKTRHLSYEWSSPLISKSFNPFDRIKSLRTLLTSFGYFEQSTIFITLPKLKCLRVLSFHSFQCLIVLPDSISELIHLRYLDLSYTLIEILPESLGDLYNLQTLKLFRCALTMLPNSMRNLANLRHLDIRGTYLTEMPPGMSKLKNLQFLSDFVVGKHEENGIKELGILSDLHRSLSISKLENIANSSEAAKARILDKTHIELLTLKWSEYGDKVTSECSKTERDILDKLKPHKGLQELTIMGYRGTTFSDWVGHSSYYNMTRVSLKNCSNCCMLPSLGQLPSLKSLEIKGFDKVMIIDAKFYKRDDDHPSSSTFFPSLENLSFYNMSCWEEWYSSEPNAFLKLKSLKIIACSKLTGNLPDHLPALETLEIGGCRELVSSLPRTPIIRELKMWENDRLVGLEEIPLSLQSLSIAGDELVKSMVEAMNISQPTSLQSLEISDCSCVVSFRIPGSVKNLKIEDCTKLEFPNHQQHQLLKSLEIHGSCDSLTSFPLDSFPNLDFLELNCCENLESLLVSQDSALQDLFICSYNKLKSISCHMNTLLSKLEYLSIRSCSKMDSFPDVGLLPSLKRLHINDCKKLKSLPCHMNTLLPELEHLRITSCPGIGSFPDGGLPPNLNSLQIDDSEKLLGGLSSMGMHDGLTNLQIRGPCESVKSFPKEGSLPQLPSLTFLCLSGLLSLQTLECKELHHHTSLQKLIIICCPILEKMTGEKLPASLIELRIYRCHLLEEQCKTKHPEIWPKISHIRDIFVDDIEIT